MTRSELVTTITDTMGPGELVNLLTDLPEKLVRFVAGEDDDDLLTDSDVQRFANLLADYVCDD